MNDWRQRVRGIFDDDTLRQRVELYRALGIPLESLAVLSGRTKSELCRLDRAQMERHNLYRREQRAMSKELGQQLLAAIRDLSEEIRRLRAAIESK